MTPLRHLTDFLGLRRSMVGLLGMVILVGLGEKMAERFLPLYLLALGGGALSVGLLNGLDNLLSALYSLPGGYLADRLGTKRALLIFNMLAMAGFLVVIVIPAWEAVIAGSCLFLSWTAISLPASMGLVAQVLPNRKRTMGVAMHSLVRRFPMALGPVIGGWFIVTWGTTTGVRLAFVAALVLAVVAAAMQQVLIAPDPPRGAKAEPEAATGRALAAPLRAMREMHPDLRNLLASDILIRFCEQIPYAFVVLWAMQTIAQPVDALQFGMLTTIEMAVAAAIYIPVAHFADRLGKKPFVLITFVFFTLFPLALLFAHSFWPLVGAFVLRGLKEFGDSTRKALILDLAPDGRQALTFGMYYLVRDTIVSVAAFGGALLWMIRPEVNFLTAFGFGVLGTICFAVYGRDVAPGRVANGE
ncbi:MAG: MFS transporter [Planctomycetota bacterium]